MKQKFKKGDFAMVIGNMGDGTRHHFELYDLVEIIDADYSEISVHAACGLQDQYVNKVDLIKLPTIKL